MKLSIVSTMYRSSPYLRDFCKRTLDAVKALEDDFELILVNDGSPDGSLELALELQAAEPRIQIVDLARNFGHHAAIVAGIAHAKGDLIFLIDCDLEEQPEWLHYFMSEMTSANVDVVFGVQQERVASRASNFLGELFWKSLNAMSSIEIPHNPMTCRLMNRAYVDALLSVEDRVLYLAGVFAWTGFKQISIPLKKIPRHPHHQSTYSFSRKLFQVTDSIASFSAAPLSGIFLVGLGIWLGSIVVGIYLLAEKLRHPSEVLSGFTSLMLSIWFLSGTIIMALGVIGLYISKIFHEVKRRPLYITKKIYKAEQHE
jgi:putative glycosyltransferase